MIHGSGQWSVSEPGRIIAKGQLSDFQLMAYHSAEMIFAHNLVSLFLDHKRVSSVPVERAYHGQIAWGCGYHQTCFKNLSLGPLDESTPVHVRMIDDADPIITYSEDFVARSGSYTNWRRTYHESNHTGQTAAFTISGNGFALIGRLFPGGGSAVIEIDGQIAGHFSSNSPDTRHRSVLYQHTFESAGCHRIRLITEKDDEGLVQPIILDAIIAEANPYTKSPKVSSSG